MNIFNKILHWYFTKKALPYWVIVFLDSFIIFVSGCFISVLTDGMVATIQHWEGLCISMMAFLCCYFVGMRLLHTYSGFMRYSTFADLQRVAGANMIGLGLTLPLRVHLWDVGLTIMGYYDLVALFLIATSLMWSLRMVIKYFHQMGADSQHAKRVFIYGTKNGGVSLAKGIREGENRQYILAGIVSGDKNYVDKQLMGVKVVMNDLTLVEEMKRQNATVLLVSPFYSDKFRAQTELIDRLIDANIQIHMMPTTIEWDGKSPLQHEALKEVEIEDLLPREKIEVAHRLTESQKNGGKTRFLSSKK